MASSNRIFFTYGWRGKTKIPLIRIKLCNSTNSTRKKLGQCYHGASNTCSRTHVESNEWEFCLPGLGPTAITHTSRSTRLAFTKFEVSSSLYSNYKITYTVRKNIFFLQNEIQLQTNYQQKSLEKESSWKNYSSFTKNVTILKTVLNHIWAVLYNSHHQAMSLLNL